MVEIERKRWNMESGRTKKQIISRRRLRLSVFNADDAPSKRKNEKYLLYFAMYKSLVM